MNKNTGPFLAFDKRWFEKHQQVLLFLLNNPALKRWFRWVLRIRNCDCSLTTKITNVSPNSFSFGDRYFKKGSKWLLERTTDFRTHSKFAKRIYFAFRPVWWLMHFWDWAILDRFELVKRFSFGFDTLTAYPNAGSGGTTVDGIVERNRGAIYPDGETFGTIRTSTDTTNINVSKTDGLFYFGLAACPSPNTNKYYSLGRAGFTFDTSSITLTPNISSAVFSWYGFTSSPGLNQSLVCCAFAPTSNNNLVAGDYNISKWGSSEYSNTRIADDALAESYNDYSFNATGIAAINKTGITKVGLRLSSDFDNTAPTWVSDIFDYFRGYFADQAGTSQDPKLVVTYSTYVTLVRTASVSVSNSASRLATVAKISILKRVASAAVSVASSRLSTLVRKITFKRTSAVSVSRSASRNINVSFVRGVIRSVAVSVSVSASRIATVARKVTYIRQASAVVSISALRAINVLRSMVLIRSTSVSVSVAASRTVTLSRIIVRSIKSALVKALIIKPSSKSYPITPQGESKLDKAN